MKENIILTHQQAVLRALAGKIDNFYLAGGTALSLFYFQHRLSVDLDFFTPKFTPLEISRIMGSLKKSLKVKVELIAESLKGESAKMMVYNVYFDKGEPLKVDFVEDTTRLIKKPKTVDGINILSLEDIYIRKIFTLIGHIKTTDKIGRVRLAGARSDAKDFYDLYVLSHTFRPLSRFTAKYGTPVISEGLVKWFHVYDRMDMIDGILSLDTYKRKIDYKKQEEHFKNEIEKIIDQNLGGI